MKRNKFFMFCEMKRKISDSSKRKNAEMTLYCKLLLCNKFQFLPDEQYTVLVHTVYFSGLTFGLT